MKPNSIPCDFIRFSRRETALMREGRRHRSNRKPKTLAWWLQTALGLIWAYVAIRGACAIPLLGKLQDNPQAMQEVVTSAVVLGILSVCLLITHFKTKR